LPAIRSKSSNADVFADSGEPFLLARALARSVPWRSLMSASRASSAFSACVS
jgi:hypothetical protein